MIKIVYIDNEKHISVHGTLYPLKTESFHEVYNWQAYPIEMVDNIIQAIVDSEDTEF